MAQLPSPAKLGLLDPATFKYGAGVGATVGRRHRRKGEERQIARRRIEHLFELAHRRTLAGDDKLADRAVGLARRIAMRYQTGLLRGERDRLCRSCHAYLAPGTSARVRAHGGMVRTTCLTCGHVQRRPYLREQAERRAMRASARHPEPAITPLSNDQEEALVSAPGSE